MHCRSVRPTRHTALVGEHETGDNPSMLYTVLLDAEGRLQRIVPGSNTDLDAALPVRFRLPDGRGWVVAAYRAELRYRTSAEQPWQPAGRDAALLPDAAVQVEVTAAARSRWSTWGADRSTAGT